MSVQVPLDELASQIDRFGPVAYLSTVSDDGRPHTTSSPVRWENGALIVGAGRRSTANATVRPLVSLLWPPIEAGGYGLVVDGEARITADTCTINPTWAVLHQTASA